MFFPAIGELWNSAASACTADSAGRWILHVLGPSVLNVMNVPSHIAFIMDGNRRFRKKHSSVSLPGNDKHGHKAGFASLLRALHTCLKAGVKTVTVFAFAVENFNRDAEEVKSLFELAAVKFEELAQNKDIIEKHGVKICILGDTSRLPEHLQVSMAKMVLATEQNTGATLNVCFAYSSTLEMNGAVKSISSALRDGELMPEDVDEALISSCLLLLDRATPRSSSARRGRHE